MLAPCEAHMTEWSPHRTPLRRHYKKADMVLGHEGVGLISHVGSAVRDFKVGDRVGWGYNHNSCHNCSACTSGRDTFCDERQMYGVADLDMGGFSDVAVLNHLFVHRIPEGLSLSDAAPLQCGGATVFGAIFDSGVKSWDRVGVVGIGGLGHLGESAGLQSRSLPPVSVD